MEQLKLLISEVHRRSLWQVLAIYLGASWLVFEIVQTVTEGLGLPQWFPAFAALLLLIGLPVVLATAFVQEGMSPARRPDPTLMPSAEPEARPREVVGVRRLFTWRNAISGGVLALALWGVVATGWYVLYGDGEATATVARKSIAVLPFDNLSRTEENEPFTDGIHDDLLTQLYKIGDLKPISRTSVLVYKNTTKNLRQIAEELGVATVLEGGVQRAGKRVRINVQLIDAQTDEHLWADVYDRELSAENIFAIQSDIAHQIAAALKSVLTPEEKARIAIRPTENLEAYDYYLRGNDYFYRSWDESDLRIAAQMYGKAVGLDPNFTLAYAMLSRTHARLYWYYYDRSEDRLSEAEMAVRRAGELGPNLAEFHIALGYFHYWGRRDYQAALDQFAAAQRTQPNNSDLALALGAVQRRQGRWSEAVANIMRASDLDPLSNTKAAELATTYLWLRMYPESERYQLRAIAIAPDWAEAYIRKARLYIAWEGDKERAREALMERSEPTIPGTFLASSVSGAWGLFRILYDDYQEALELLSRESFGADSGSYFLAKGEVYAKLGLPELAEAHYDSARMIAENTISLRPADSYYHRQLGVAYAALGWDEEAIREGKKAVELLSVSRDAMDGVDSPASLAEIHVMVGDYDHAIDLLEYLLSVPGWLSVHWLQLDPTWDALRGHARFQALLDEYD